MDQPDRAFARVILALFALVLLFGAMFAEPALAAEAKRVEALDWHSPLGLRVTRYEVQIDGAPLLGPRQAELRDSSGRLLHRHGNLDGLLAEIAGEATRPHPATTKTSQHPRGTAAWILKDGALRPVYRERQVDLRDFREPRVEEILRDSLNGEVLERRNLVREVSPQGMHVYAHPDGRPALSPFGDTWPHPTGVPDGWLPGTGAVQSVMTQADIAIALPEPWFTATATETTGNNVVAYFNALALPGEEIDPSLDGYSAPFDAAQGDFFATANSGTDFVYGYDPAQSIHETFHFPSGPAEAADAADAQLNAKIVQAFFSINWLHDFFYRAGFDEVAGNSQQDNFGRGGKDGDPLIVLAGFPTTFAAILPDGESAYLALGLNYTSDTQRDASMDFSVAGHEWGHVMIHRLGMGVDGLQSRALHEGISDFIGVLVGVSADDDLNGAFPTGQYFNLDYVRPEYVPPAGVAADAMYYGVRRYPYSLDAQKNPLMFHNLIVPPDLPYYDWKGRGPQLDEAHTAGEIFAQALFQCFGAMAAGNSAAEFEATRLRMAQYLVAGLTLFSSEPTFLEARNRILDVVRAVDAEDYTACRKGFAERGLGAGAIGTPAAAETYTTAFNGPLEQDEKLLISDASLVVADCNDCAAGEKAAIIEVEIINAGLVDSETIEITVVPRDADAVEFTQGAVRDFELLSAQQRVQFNVPLRAVVDALPGGVLAYTVEARITGADVITGHTRGGEADLSDPVLPRAASGGGSSDWLLMALLAGLLRRRR